jgi:hypothetical protein
LQRRRVADEFEQPEQAQDPQGPQVERDELMQIPRQDREQVDDHHRPYGEFESRSPRRQPVQ